MTWQAIQAVNGYRASYPGLEVRGRGGIGDSLATPAGRKCKHSPFFFAFGWGGHESETFRRARQRSFDDMISLCSRN